MEDLKQYIEEHRQRTLKNRELRKLRISNEAPKLTISYIDNIMKTYIIPHNKELTYELTESKSTESIYLTLKYRNAKGKIRFSDHDTKKHLQSLNLNEENYSTKSIVNTIQVRVRDLVYKSMMIAFQKLKKK